MNPFRLKWPSIPGVLLWGLAWPLYAGPLDDPTRPPDFQGMAATKAPAEIPKEVTDFRLRAVKVGAHSRWAIINDERVVEGDKIGPAQVLQIQPDRVLIDYDGQQITLSLLAQDVKSPPRAGQPQGKKP